MAIHTERYGNFVITLASGTIESIEFVKLSKTLLEGFQKKLDVLLDLTGVTFKDPASATEIQKIKAEFVKKKTNLFIAWPGGPISDGGNLSELLDKFTQSTDAKRLKRLLTLNKNQPEMDKKLADLQMEVSKTLAIALSIEEPKEAYTDGDIESKYSKFKKLHQKNKVIFDTCAAEIENYLNHQEKEAGSDFSQNEKALKDMKAKVIEFFKSKGY